MGNTELPEATDGIAIVGMAGRFPGAKNLDEFWRNLRAGVESITFLTDEELRASGVSPAMLRDPHYVKAAGVLDDIELFDAPFFNFTPREAEVTDPQQRLFLECAWEALENAGYVGENFDGSIAVYAGASISGYLFHLYARRELLDSIGGFRALLGNDKDFLPTWVSYKLNLKGPSVNVQTACSTALVAIHLACQSLLNYQCDMALSGGVTVAVPQKIGYLYQKGGIHSLDGHCRAFDAEAEGVVGGSGVGIVVLKRLEDAIADRDYIHAVIRGSAVNNDGALKVGFTAPSVQGQAEVIALAHAIARVKAEDITYVEAHGSATPIGDPIEISALTKAFRLPQRQKNVCAVGSVKTNIGHAGAAAGVAGLMKTVLALQNKTIPPSLHFSRPNPQIDFANSPFYVNSEPVAWPAGRTPRVAGVSSFGIGGTNAHVVLEEALPSPSVASARPWQLLVLSARTVEALETATDNLVAYFEQHPEANLADVAYTLQVGRKVFDHRRALVCRDVNDALEALRTRDPRRILNSVKGTDERPVVFMLSGLGDHYVDMGWQLYCTEAVFREQLDRCAQLLMPILREDIRAVLYPGKELTQRTAASASAPDKQAGPGLNLRQMLGRGGAQEDAAAQKLNRTTLTQPALFSIEYALAQLWISFGVRPQALIGYSLGEYVAACLSDVLSLEDALSLVAQRAQMIDELPAGTMLAVSLAEAEVRPLLGAELSLSAVNGPELCVVAGPGPAVAALEQELTARGVACRRVQSSHAFHSRMMEPIGPHFTQLFAGLTLKPPRTPYISNVTGTWITEAEATAPAYWACHLNQAVRFADGVSQLMQRPAQAWLEIGPGQTLCSLVQQHPRLDKAAEQVILPSLPQSYDRQPETAFMLNTLAQLWLTGVDVDWPKFHAQESRRRVPLPTYPFERQHYWISAPEADREVTATFGHGANGSEQGLDTVAPAASDNGRHEPAHAAAVKAEQFSSTLYPRPNLRTAYVAPGTRLEQQVAAVWQEVLGIQQVGIYDRFLDLGGHSLLATQLISRLRDTFHLDLSLRAFFEAPTIAQLAVMIDFTRQAPETEAPPNAPSLARVSRAQPLPLSFAQQRLWFLDQLEPGSAFYNLSAAIRLRGALEVEALEQTLQQVVARHEALRTTFGEHDGRPVQLISPDVSLRLPVINLAHLTGGAREAEARRLATEQALEPFDLARGPLVRAVALRLSADEHVVVLTMHHIVSDGWSMGVLVNEIGRLYRINAGAGAGADELDELPIQYADYAVWQRDWLQGSVLAEQLAYWRKQLGGRLPVLELPTDRPRPPVQGFRGATEHFTLSPALTEQLKELGRTEDATLFMVLLAAFQTLLYRYTGEDDVVVGTPIANRTRREVEGLIGFFVNTLVLRTQLGGDPTFRELLGRVKEVALGAYAHQDVPFEKLVEELQPERDMSRTPLFQVLFVLQNAPLGEQQLPGLTMQPLDVDGGTAKFDLTLNLMESPNGLGGWVEYNVDLFDAATVARLVQHFQVLLGSIVAAPAERLSALRLLTEGERRQLLDEWNDTERGYQQTDCVHQLFEAQSARSPAALAVADGKGRLSYGELNERANRLAHYLRRLGVRAETHVGICVERSVEMVVGLLGILKAGGAYVPFDPSSPAERLAVMLKDSGAPVLLTQAHLAEGLPDSQAQIVRLDADWPLIAKESAADLPNEATAQHAAYMIYTSGSTGLPKGVEITHGSLLNLVHWHHHAYQVGPADRSTQTAGLGFDASVWELWPYLTAGASIHVLDDETRTFPAQLRDWLVAQEVNLSFLPTPLAESALAVEWPTGAALRALLTGGDKLSHHPPPGLGFDLINHYGPTESTVVTTAAVIKPAQGYSAHIAPTIGRPIANTQVYILDRNLQVLPVGVPGELYIAGDGLARGYFNEPAQTAAKFIPNPFSRRPGARLYRTGDSGRFLVDGQIEFLGRLDQQVKVRGFRIELGEIEAALNQHPRAQQTVVIARADEGQDKSRLVAYIVAKERADAPTKGELRGWLKERLPEYMVPAAFVVLDEWPLTPNGKVDRQALPSPDELRGADATEEYVAARTPVEEVVAGVWRDVLKVERIGVHDNFFDLGGHSLLATQAVSRLREIFGVEITLRTFFVAATVAELAQALERGETRAGRTTKIARMMRKIEGMSAAEVSAAVQRREQDGTGR